jgi:ribosomal protein L40E
VNNRYLSPLEGFPWSVRNAILKADGHRCRKCGAAENLEVDHIKPIHHGGEDNFENAQTLCRECHARKSHYEEWIKSRPATNLLNPLASSSATDAIYYVVPAIWNATRGQWEQYGPFLTYEEAWQWVESREKIYVEAASGFDSD